MSIKDLFDIGRRVVCPCCGIAFRAKRKTTYMIPKSGGGYKLVHDCPHCRMSVVYGKKENK